MISKSNGESTINFGFMPTFIGTVDPRQQFDEDRFHQMLWGKHQNGTFGVIDLPNFSDIYINQHNEPVGTLWVEHHRQFADFVIDQDSVAPARVLEIGPGSGALLTHLVRHKEKFEYIDTIDPNPLNFSNPLGKNLRGSFPTGLSKTSLYNQIIHSHLIEHVPDVIQFLKDCNDLLDIGDSMIFSLPNMREMAENLDLNILMFEHVTFLPLEEIFGLLEHCGFKATRINHYFTHSIFLATKKVGTFNDSRYNSKIRNAEFNELARKFRDELVEFTKMANSFLSEDKSHNFLFGAHIFSQYLLGSGLDDTKIHCILDNSNLKNKMRLYGSKLICRKPNEVSFCQNARIILAAGQYENEIIKDLKTLLPKGVKLLSKKRGEVIF